MKEQPIINQIANTFMLLVPLILVGYTLKLIGDNTIEIIDKIYLCVICLAIVTYWVIEFIKRNEMRYYLQ